MRRCIYLGFAAVGLALPYYFFIGFVAENGVDLGLMARLLFGNGASAFFAADLLITGAAFLAYLLIGERWLSAGRRWAAAIATLVVGPSFALPLYLYFRETADAGCRDDSGMR